MTEQKPPRLLHGRSPELYEALKAAGIIRDGDRVRRIIIDIDATAAVVVYVERTGDERLLDLVRTLDGAEIRTGKPAEGAGAVMTPGNEQERP